MPGKKIAGIRKDIPLSFQDAVEELTRWEGDVWIECDFDLGITIRLYVNRDGYLRSGTPHDGMTTGRLELRPEYIFEQWYVREGE